MRDFQVSFKPAYNKPIDHSTSRKCDNHECGGDLEDHIIYQDEHISNEAKGKIAYVAMDTDLLICFGTRMKSLTDLGSVLMACKMTGGQVAMIQPFRKGQE